MPPATFATAKSVLNDADISRILCVYFHTAPSSVDWDKAAQEFGAPTVESFRHAMRRMMKRIDDASQTEFSADAGEGSSSPGSNASNTGKKRTESDDEEEAPAPKAKRGRKAAKKAARK
ncbi:Hypothetical predicted protein [Lecanosticta acicola]|uniref:Uncharacterized protein n=1 Tax=Lecanosticta acicola TaxID=111012 RepID=A0AAI8Z2L2_9PEZI|nr:Hypothetical predicted protein [Lecanosticta acicola]